MLILSRFRHQVVVFLTTLALAAPLLANPIIPVPTQPQQFAFSTPSAPNLNATSYILIDALSGKILAEKDANKRLPPASLTKLMTLYVASSALQNNSIQLTDKVRISTLAWKAEGSRMFVKAGEEVPVKTLMQGVIVASGNDAAIALSEHVAGSEDAFAAIMNQQAKLLGMNDSHFVDSTGLPNKEHYSTAHDLAVLTQAYIKHFPEDYAYYSEKWFTYNGIRQPNRNRLLWRYQYADGLKTGHTSEAGYCLVASAKKDGMRLISIVMGAPSDATRTEDSIRLLTYGFRFFETHKLYNNKTPLVQASVWQGTKSQIPLGVANDMYVTVPTGQYKKLQISTQLTNPLKAPITQGQVCGTLNVTLNNEVIASRPLIALDSSTRGNLWRRAADAVKFNFHKYFSKPNDKLNTG
ncbi:MAG: serine-type D-Ala-D-Ala carboxypeptidase [Gammaproteobacteria bacterium RIFCSPHIGHO2_12_FULL_45_12]|nr:MAG: serine-type D-Ala-D-Ala carboxypeptidase [Gammaproteobacteria bacterium RIFCSPHIGHO2_12_FULL_45_12]